MNIKRTMIIAIAAAIVIAIAVIVALNYTGYNSKLQNISLAPNVRADNQGSGDEIKDENNDVVQYLEITPDNVQNVVSTIARAENYYCTMNIVNYWDEGQSVYQVESWVSNEVTRIIINREDRKEESKNFLIKDNVVYVWYGSERNVYSTTISETLSGESNFADELSMIPTYEDVIKLKKGDIANAGYVVYDDTRYINIETAENELGYKDKYYISLETGLLTAAETTDNEKVVYRMLMLSMDTTSISEEIFAIPH